jgi:hypothetical protein
MGTNTVPVTVNNTYGWAEVGTPKVKGQVVAVGADGFDVVSGGRGYWANYDEIDIAYMTKTGDFDVKVQVIEAEYSSQWSRCGIAARNELNVGMARPADTTEVSTAGAYCELHANPNKTLAATWDPNDPVPIANPNPNNNFEQNQRGSWLDTTGWGARPDQLRLIRTSGCVETDRRHHRWIQEPDGQN